MKPPKSQSPAMGRRDFMAVSAAAVAGAAVVAPSASVLAQTGAGTDGLIHRNERPDKMTYRKLGRTNFMSSRLVFGCGAALQGGKGVNLLERAFEEGVNFFDVGSNSYYKQSENNLAPFMKRRRADIWVTSKAPIRLGTVLREEDELTVELAKQAADIWTRLLEASLKDLDTDYIDAYYIMMVDHPAIVKCAEIREAFDKAKAAGKVGHFGISTHRRANVCLEAAVEAGWYDLAMIAVTPAGWFDMAAMGPVRNGPDLKGMRPSLDKAREAGIGLIGMKTGRFLAPMAEGGRNKTDAFDTFYGEKLLGATLSPFQRAYAYVLENGLDVMNADMQNFGHFEENLVAARTSHEYLA